jgi:hypothetical protein
MDLLRRVEALERRMEEHRTQSMYKAICALNEWRKGGCVGPEPPEFILPEGIRRRMEKATLAEASPQIIPAKKEDTP